MVGEIGAVGGYKHGAGRSGVGMVGLVIVTSRVLDK